MTNKEAAEVLKIIHTDENGVVREPLNIAIKALEQEPCEDAISRENLLLWLDDIKESARKHVGFILDVQRYIRSMPSVTPQPKTAHWETRNIFPNWLYCSECDEPYGLNDRPRYCPNCGAKMEVEE